MKQDLSNKRKNYSKINIDFNALNNNPIEQFAIWFKVADTHPLINEANAMSLSTVESNNSPRTRVVLLKSYSEEGFVFYTNYNSQKSKALLLNPNVCISFFWPVLEQQIIIKGLASKVEEGVSNNYFAKRPRESQLAAWVSHQSESITLNKNLEEDLLFYKNKFKNKPIPRPKYWGGFIIKPIEFEFWQGRPNRLHDRARYSITDNNWTIERLAP